jgi:hypothetical protein
MNKGGYHVFERPIYLYPARRVTIVTYEMISKILTPRSISLQLPKTYTTAEPKLLTKSRLLHSL